MALKLKLKLKPNPLLDSLLQIRPPIRIKKFLENPALLVLQFPIQLKQFTEQEEKAYHRQRRIRILEDYGKRQEKRTTEQKAQDFVEPEEHYQRAWVEFRLKGNARSWERWNGVIEEWEPWNRYGEPVNIWRYRKL